MAYTSSVSGEIDPLYSQKNVQMLKNRLARQASIVSQLRHYAGGDRNPILDQFTGLQERAAQTASGLDTVG